MLFTLLAALLLAACGGGDSSNDTSVSADEGASAKLRMLLPVSDQAYPEVVENFKKQNPDIDVELQEVPVRTFGQLIATQLQAGSGPDLMFSTPGTQAPFSVLNLVAADHLADVSDVGFADRVMDGFRPYLTEDGKLYAWPMGTGTTEAYYDVDAFEELGLELPTTFSEMLKLCGRVKQAGKTLFMHPAGEATFNSSLLATLAGNEVFSHDPDWAAKRRAGDVSFADTPGWRRVLEQILEMNDAGCFQPQAASVDASGAPREWAKGKALAMVGSPGGTSAIRAATPDVDFKVFAMPADEAEDTTLTLGHAATIVVNADSEQLDAAKKLLGFLAEPEQSRLWNEQGGTIASVDEVKGVVPEIYEPLRPFFDEGRTIVTSDYTTPPQVFAARGEGVQGLLTGQKDVDAVLADLDAAWDAPAPTR